MGFTMQGWDALRAWLREPLLVYRISYSLFCSRAKQTSLSGKKKKKGSGIKIIDQSAGPFENRRGQKLMLEYDDLSLITQLGY